MPGIRTAVTAAPVIALTAMAFVVGIGAPSAHASFDGAPFDHATVVRGDDGARFELKWDTDQRWQCDFKITGSPDAHLTLNVGHGVWYAPVNAQPGDGVTVDANCMVVGAFQFFTGNETYRVPSPQPKPQDKPSVGNRLNDRPSDEVFRDTIDRGAELCKAINCADAGKPGEPNTPPQPPQPAGPAHTVTISPGNGSLTVHVHDNTGKNGTCTYDADEYHYPYTFTLNANQTADLYVSPSYPQNRTWNVTVSCDNGNVTHTTINY